jgi:hypothetical protein
VSGWEGGHKNECSKLLKPLAGVKWNFASPERVGALDLFVGENAAKADQSGVYGFFGSTSDLVEMLRQQDVVDTDCMVFATIVANVNAKIDETLPLVFEFARDPTIGFANTSIKPFYIAPTRQLYQLLAGKTSAVGQWVLPAGKGKYLGMSSEGPRVLTPSAWRKTLIQGVMEDLPKSGPFLDTLFKPSDYFLWPDGLVGHPDAVCLVDLD